MTNHNTQTFAWKTVHGVTPGRDHLRRGISCQDAAWAGASPRPALIVCDGRGSAPLSHYGANAAVRMFQDWLSIAEPFLQAALDGDEPAAAWETVALSLYQALAQAQLQLVAQRGGRTRDFEFTAVAFVGGQQRGGWLVVGDSVLVAEQDGALTLLGSVEGGEHANETRFIRPLAASEIRLQSGTILMDRLQAVSGFSDGSAVRLLHLQSGRPAGALAQLAAGLRQGELSTEELHELLTDRDWDAATGDDRSLAILSRCQGAPEPLEEEEVYELPPPSEVKKASLQVKPAVKSEVDAPTISEDADAQPTRPGSKYIFGIWTFIIFGAGLDLGLFVGVFVRLYLSAY